MKESYKIELKCLYCDFALMGEENKEFQSGDLIICSCCNKGNDYDSLLEVAMEDGIKLIKGDLLEKFIKTLKKI